MTSVLASGYGVMFTVLDDFPRRVRHRRVLVGCDRRNRVLASFVSQIALAPIADRGRRPPARALGLGAQCRGHVGNGIRRRGLRADRRPLRDGHRRRDGDTRRTTDRDHTRAAQPRAATVGLLLACDVAGFAAGPAVSAILVPAFGIPAPFLADSRWRRCSPFPSCCARTCRRATSAPTQNRFAFDSASIASARRRSPARWRVVHDDRHVRRTVGDRAR